MVAAEVLEETVEDLVAVVSNACDLIEGNGVGGGGEENSLIDIQPDTDDRSGDLVALPEVLYKNTGEFTVGEIEVVGPLDGKERLLVVCEERQDGSVEGQTDDLIEEELTGNGDVPIAQKGREKEVLATFALPAVALLSASGGLEIGIDGEEVFAVKVLTFDEVVGAVG